LIFFACLNLLLRDEYGALLLSLVVLSFLQQRALFLTRLCRDDIRLLIGGGDEVLHNVLCGYVAFCQTHPQHKPQERMSLLISL